MLNVEKIMNWPFSEDEVNYTKADTVRYAYGYGAGLPGDLQAGDTAFLDEANPKVLPFMAVPLCDGEFWPQDPSTGIDWQKMIHAGEGVTVHRPLPAEGKLILTQKVEKLLDRGPERGATMVQQQVLSDEKGPVATVDVTTILKGNGGFGGEPDNLPRDKWVPQDRPADITVDVRTPTLDNKVFQFQFDIAVADLAGENQKVVRGVGCFGLAGRAAVYALCDNQPERLKKFSVRYSGVMLTDETMRVELWHLSPGRAAMQVSSVERDQLVLNNCLVEYE